MMWDGKNGREKRKVKQRQTLTKPAGTVLGGPGAPTVLDPLPHQHPLSSSQVPPVGSASMWIASQCQAGHSLFWEPSQALEGAVPQLQLEGRWFLHLRQILMEKLVDKPPSLHSLWWVDSWSPLPCLLRHPSGADAQVPTWCLTPLQAYQVPTVVTLTHVVTVTHSRGNHSMRHSLLAFLSLLIDTTAFFRACFQRNPN